MLKLKDGRSAFAAAEGIVLTQKDVRELQLAKARSRRGC